MGDPAFAHITQDGEIWPCIIEKAFAKMAGSYAKLEGGSPCLALGMLTGCLDNLEIFKSGMAGGHCGKWVCRKPKFKSVDYWHASNEHARIQSLFGATHDVQDWPDGHAS